MCLYILDLSCISTVEPEQDVLTCGNCQKDFLLSEITKFIQHKVSRCNKENVEPFDEISGDFDESISSVISSRRTSISAPIANKATGGDAREKLSPRPATAAAVPSQPDTTADSKPGTLPNDDADSSSEDGNHGHTTDGNHGDTTDGNHGDTTDEEEEDDAKRTEEVTEVRQGVDVACNTVYTGTVQVS